MKKGTLFISAALTTFMLAVMFGVASAYQKIVQAAGPTDAVAQAKSNDVNLEAANPIVGSAFTAEQAASLASSVIGRTDLYTAEIAQIDGVDAYLVTFSSGDIVFVSMSGQILSISKLPVTVILAPASGGSQNSGSSINNNSNSNDDSNYNDNGNYNDNDEDDDDDDDHDENENEGDDD